MVVVCIINTFVKLILIIMKKTRSLLFALSLLGLFYSCSDETVETPDTNLKSTYAASDASVTVQWNQEKQEIDGFGIAQAGWADQLYKHRKRSEIMGWLFGDQGLDLSILRGEVFPHYSTSRGHRDFALNENIDISLDDPFFDPWSSEDMVRRGQLWITREAKKTYGVDKLMFSTWSPPAYMKSNGSVSKGYLKLGEYQAFADYLADFVKAYESYGLPVYALSPANEPEYAAEWNSCVWFPGSTTLGPFIVKNLGPTFKNRGITSKIIFGENAQWSTFALIMGSLKYVNGVIDLNPSITNLDVIASGHGYPNPITNERIPIVPYTKAESKGMNVWLTEVSTIDNLDPSMQNGLNWAADFHRYLSDANVSAIVWWAGARPTTNNESLIVLDQDRTGYSFTKRFDTFGNFTKYIKPGSRRVTIDRGSQIPADMHVSSYKKGNEYVVVAVNNTDQDVVSKLTINGTLGVKDMKRVLTDAENRWAESVVAPEANGDYMLDVPAKSVVTFTGSVK